MRWRWPKGEPELRDLVGQVVEDVREVLTEKWIVGAVGPRYGQ